ncbi:MAG: glycosyltransferase family 4 protein [Desulfuromonadales bacterium]|nr:glycosyltransferase family 4 protein [Desulfuromonadales bacterium]
MTIWFLSEVYYPDEQGTAFYTTGIAEGLASSHDVHVLCSCPTVTARGSRVARKEVRNGVTIERCMGTTLNKDILPLRLINILTYSVATLVKALVSVKRGDVVIAVTSPPSSPFMAQLVAWCRGATCILRLEDVYPEILVATGMIAPKGFMDTCLGLLNRILFTSADRIVVLGRDMKALSEKRHGSGGSNISIIRSWADTDVVFPAPKSENSLLGELGLTDRFVVSCVGNMGRAQAIEFIFEAVSLLKDDNTIHFLFIGSGSKRGWMETEIERRGLKNVTIVGQRPRSEQSVFLNACDISLISLLPGVTGAGVPSRTYNLMAAGKPIIAVTREDSEVALLVREEGIGWVVPPVDADDLAQAVLAARADSGRLQRMGVQAYAAAKEKFSREKILDEYRDLISTL